MKPIPLESVLDSGDASLFDVATHAPGPSGALPLTADVVLHAAFRQPLWVQPERRHGLGSRRRLGGGDVIILSTHGGLQGADGKAVAFGLHTGHWEVD